MQRVHSVLRNPLSNTKGVTYQYVAERQNLRGG